MSQSNYLKGDQGCSKSQLGPSIHCLKAQSQDLINRLPEGCICDMFRLLNGPQDLRSCATVCWRWAELVLSLPSKLFNTWKNSLVLSGHDLDDTQLVIKVVGISTRDSVRDLHITQWSSDTAVGRGVRHLTDKGVRFATKAFRNLESVCLQGCPMITDKSMETIAANCSDLETLHLRDSSVADDGIFQISARCTNLSCLHIENCPSITVASLQALAKHAKKLTSLTLGRCPQIPTIAIVSFMTEKPDLAEVKLQSMGVPLQSAESEAATISLPMVVVPVYKESEIIHRLRNLILAYCPGLHGLLPRMFAHVQLPLLKCVVIRGCSGMNHLDLISLLGPKATLQTLELAVFSFSSYANLMEVLSSCQETIKHLTLEYCAFDQVSSPQPDDVVPRKCPQMELIKLRNCANIAKLFLPWLTAACPEVKELSLVGMADTVAGRAAISSNLYSIVCRCKMITKMNLSRSGGDDDAAACVISSLGDTLRELVLDGWSRFTGYSTEPLGKCCGNLVRLSLRDTCVGDGALRFMMSEKLPYLEEIVLEGCPGITDEALEILFSSRLPRLERLNVRGCPGVTSYAVVVHENLWSIED